MGRRNRTPRRAGAAATARADRCPDCGGPGHWRRLRRHDPRLALGVLIAGGLLTFYLVGFPLIAIGIWLWFRTRTVPACRPA